MMCPLCGEHYLIKVDEENAKCLFCSGELTGYQIANAYINDVLKISEYEVARNGGEWPLFECPICGYDAMVLDYECNEYMDEWNFENWGIKYWSKIEEFQKYIESH